MANIIINHFFNCVYHLLTPETLSDDHAIELIKKKINSDDPCLISRIGSCELQLLVFMKYYPFLYPFKYRTIYNIKNNAGFFSSNNENNKRFYDLYKKGINEIDVLISWRFEEAFFKKELKNKYRVNKDLFDSFYSSNNPWTQALEGKKILIVHPFVETIKKQYCRRYKLFDNVLVLPEFESLSLVKAVQSSAGNKCDFSDWFEALEFMKLEMDKCDYDVAILGCGAYGFPLAVHAKRMGKRSIYMGGVSQFLFGIKGKRYIDDEKYNKYINDYFVFPSEEERPKDYRFIEGGCYW